MNRNIGELIEELKRWPADRHVWISAAGLIVEGDMTNGYATRVLIVMETEKVPHGLKP